MSVSEFLSRLSLSRFAVVLGALIYAAALNYAHAVYLSTTWQDFNFSYFAVDSWNALLAALLVIVGAMFLPARLSRASSVLLLLLFAVVYVPTIVITVGVTPQAMSLYGAGLAALAAGFSLACVAVRLQRPSAIEKNHLPSLWFTRVVLGLWLGCAALLIWEYASIMRFVGMAELYDQRAAGASTSLLLGYAQTYFSNVFSPAMIALGLVRKRWALVVLGVLGCLIMYMINAQRAVLLLPVAIVGLYVLLANRHRVLSSSAFLTAVLGLVVLALAQTHEVNAIAAFAAELLVFRTLAVPGLTFSQYYEVFSTGGYTWWSHVRGISLFVPAPPWYEGNPQWPSLGYFIGDWFYSAPMFNINANLFSGDGVAAAGPLGVFVMGAVLAMWLVVLDRASRGWNNVFVMLVTLPVAISLTNGPLFTILLSFGGLFWTLLFFLYKPRTPGAIPVRARADGSLDPAPEPRTPR